MLRLIGILTGSSIAIAFLIIALGVPEFSEPNIGVEPLYSAKPDNAKKGVEPLFAPMPVSDEEVEAIYPEIPLVPAGIQQDPEKAVRPLLAEAEDESEKAVRPHFDETEALIEQIFAPQEDEPAVGENWYAFWSPFRSEIAADGFVAKLQESTGIDYRVVKVKTGVYEVAFAYHDEADIESKLALISSATGLDMSGG